MSHSVAVLVLLAVALMSLASAAPSFDLLPSDAEVAQLVRRSAYSGWAALRQAAAQAACETQCFKDKYYTGMPTGGYDKDAACKAMKAAYQCTVDAAGCVDAATAAKYKLYIEGYNFWCPN